MGFSRSIAFTLAAIVLVLPRAAIALPFSVELQAVILLDADPPLGPLIVNTPNVAPSPPTSQISFDFPATEVIGPFTGSFARAALSYNARLGDLSGFVNTATGGTTSDAVATGQMIWADTFTVVSSVLPLGTLVPFAATMKLTSDVTLETGIVVGKETDFQVGADARWNIFARNLVSVRLTNLVNVASGPLVSNKTDVDTEPLLLGVGDSFRVEGFLAIFDEGHQGDTNRTVFVPGSATFFLDSLSPDASYTTASGLTYFTPSSVPQDSTLSLLGFGLVGLAGARVWRIRRRLSRQP